jgi:hypothetical protein
MVQCTAVTWLGFTGRETEPRIWHNHFQTDTHSVETGMQRWFSRATVRIMICLQGICPTNDEIVEQLQCLTNGQWNMARRFHETLLDVNILICVCVWDIFIMLSVMWKSTKTKTVLTQVAEFAQYFGNYWSLFAKRANNYNTYTLTMKLTNTFQGA